MPEEWSRSPAKSLDPGSMYLQAPQPLQWQGPEAGDGISEDVATLMAASDDAVLVLLWWVLPQERVEEKKREERPPSNSSSSEPTVENDVENGEKREEDEEAAAANFEEEETVNALLAFTTAFLGTSGALVAIDSSLAPASETDTQGTSSLFDLFFASSASETAKGTSLCESKRQRFANLRREASSLPAACVAPLTSAAVKAGLVGINEKAAATSTAGNSDSGEVEHPADL